MFSQWTTEIEGEVCTLRLYDAMRMEFSCDLFDKRFPSADALERAIKEYNLSLRKDFTNTQAFMAERGYGSRGDANRVRAVTVTSIVNDKEAWVVADGKRTKAIRAGLYADRAQVEAAIAVEITANATVVAAWQAVERWQPAQAKVAA